MADTHLEDLAGRIRALSTVEKLRMAADLIERGNTRTALSVARMAVDELSVPAIAEALERLKGAGVRSGGFGVSADGEPGPLPESVASVKPCPYCGTTPEVFDARGVVKCKNAKCQVQPSRSDLAHWNVNYARYARKGGQ